MEGILDEATRTGAEEEEETQERPKSDRERMMEQIDQDYENVLAGQMTDSATPSPEDEKEGDETVQPKATETEPVLVDDLKRYRIRVKVGDSEEEKDLETVVNDLRTHQGRVRSMTQREKDLQTQLAAAKEKLEQQLKAQQQVVETTDDDIDIEARVKTVSAALIEGDEETANTVLRELLTKGRQEKATPGVDKNEIISTVKEQLQEESAKSEQARIWAEFAKEHPEFEVKEDPETGQPIVSEQRDYGDIIYARDFLGKVQSGEISYREALEKTAEKVGKMFAKPAAPQPQENELEKRQQRKETIDQLPVAAAVAARENAETAEKEDPNSIIAEMRKSRGLPE